MHVHPDFSLCLLFESSIKLLHRQTTEEQKAKIIFVAQGPCVCYLLQTSLGVALSMLTALCIVLAQDVNSVLLVKFHCCVAPFVDQNKCLTRGLGYVLTRGKCLHDLGLTFVLVARPRPR